MKGDSKAHQPRQHTLTLAMIAKDESERLPECLTSVKPIVDEIVVVDTGSSDHTIEVARSIGAKTVSFAWCDDFSAARNESLRHATGDWVLVLDADEVIAPEDLSSSRAFVDNDEFDAVQFILANYSDECQSMWWTPVEESCALARGFSGYIRVPLVRMWRNSPEYRFRGCVHETVLESIREAGGKVAETDIVVHHYGKGARAEEKNKLYLTLGMRNVSERPDDPKAHHDVATQLKELGRLDEAEHHYRHALSRDPGFQVAQSGVVHVLAHAQRCVQHLLAILWNDFGEPVCQLSGSIDGHRVDRVKVTKERFQVPVEPCRDFVILIGVSDEHLFPGFRQVQKAPFTIGPKLAESFDVHRESFLQTSADHEGQLFGRRWIRRSHEYT